MIETIKTDYGSVSVRTTSLGKIAVRMSVAGMPNQSMELYLNHASAEALQGAIARTRGMLPCPRYAETLAAVAV